MPRRKKTDSIKTAPNDLSKLKEKMEGAYDLLEVGSIDPDEVLAGDEESIADKVALAKYKRGVVKRVLGRFKKCRTANDVFSEFAKDAAKTTVLEMSLAYGSGDKQRASESILNRALGKPVDRIMSIGVQVANKSDQELDHDIEKLMEKLGFTRREGEALTLIDGGERKEGSEQVEKLSTEPGVDRGGDGVSGEVYQISSEGEDSNSGESIG